MRNSGVRTETERHTTTLTCKPRGVCGPIFKSTAKRHTLTPCAASSLSGIRFKIREIRSDNRQRKFLVLLGIWVLDLEIAPAVELEIAVGNVGFVDDSRQRGTILASNGGLDAGLRRQSKDAQ
jgi:hypothetical protein